MWACCRRPVLKRFKQCVILPVEHERREGEGEKEGIDKLRKMKNLLQGQLETFNETLMRLEKSKNKYWSKAAKVSAGALATKVQKTLDKLSKLSH